MVSFWLRDDQFERIEVMLPGKRCNPGAHRHRSLFIEAVLWIARTGSPWRDLLLSSGYGSATTSDSPVGHGSGYGIVCSRIWQVTPISRRCFRQRHCARPSACSGGCKKNGNKSLGDPGAD